MKGADCAVHASRRRATVPPGLLRGETTDVTHWHCNYGVDHLAKGAVNPVGCGDSDEDETAP